MQKYDYYFDSTSYGTRPMPLEGALAPYLGTSVQSDSWQDTQASIAIGVLQTTFICPSDLIADAQTTGSGGALATWAELIRDLSAPPCLHGYTSYFTNAEVFGVAPDNGALGNTGHVRPGGFVPALGTTPTQVMLLSDGTYPTGGGASFEFWSHNSPSTLADVFNGVTGSGPTNFDLLRHHGRMNVLYLDGHVESLTILANSGTTYISTASTPPSGDLANCYVVKGFQQ
jgi:prepilin-type processing-associated H-X9-DG protein